ncbi:MAG: hypothetical protein HW386_1226 [Gammaproteobacteria bacterium]|nr:hypothetical protein [Gammaproteobacteria bacterium]
MLNTGDWQQRRQWYEHRQGDEFLSYRDFVSNGVTKTGRREADRPCDPPEACSLRLFHGHTLVLALESPNS